MTPGKSVLPVTPGTINEKDKALLAEIGVVVIDVDDPESICLHSTVGISDSNDLFYAAMYALRNCSKNNAARNIFTETLLQLHDERMKNEDTP